MSNIIIYDAERDAGLTEIIKANASVILTASVKESEFDNIAKSQLLKCHLKTTATNLNQPDLHYLDTLLVSSGWNKNDDVFDVSEIYMARHTPEDKPFNYEHNESDIIGHITGNEVIDNNSNVLSEVLKLTELPDEIHIKTNAVIYKHWEDEAKAKRIERIIAEINEGKWFVSMEALMNNFDYALIDKSTRAHKIVARTHSTAFLTKHLKRYGGKGEFENFQVGRLLRGITFAGKGLVSKPANPKSEILHSYAKFTGKPEVLNTESNIMSDTSIQEFSKEIASLQKELMTVKADKDAALAQLEKKNQDAVHAKVLSLEEAVKARDEQINILNAKAADIQAQLDKAIADKKDGDEAEKATKKKYEEASAKLIALESQMKTAARVSTLVAAGHTQEQAEKTVATLTSLSDEQFTSVAEAVGYKMIQPANEEGSLGTGNAADAAKVKKGNNQDMTGKAKKDDKEMKDDDDDGDCAKAAENAIVATATKASINKEPSLAIDSEGSKVVAAKLQDSLSELFRDKMMKTTAGLKNKKNKENA